MVDEPKGTSFSRRDFFKLAWGSARKEAGKAMAQKVEDVDTLLPKMPRRGFTGRVRVGMKAELEQLTVGSVVTEFATTEFFFLTRTPEGWLALHNLCGHKGCRLVWEPGTDAPSRLRCPADGSAYDIYGEVVAGPAAYPLETFLMEQDADGVYVRTDTLRSRLAVDPATDPTRL